jgi:hypothetical protein
MLKLDCQKCGRKTLHTEGRAERDGDTLVKPCTCIVCGMQVFLEKKEEHPVKRAWREACKPKK